MHIEKKMTKKYLRCRWRLALAKNINIHYYYYIIIKGSIYKKTHKCLKIKFKLGYCVRYINDACSYIFQKRIFLDQNNWLILCWVRSSLTLKNLKCTTWLSFFRSSYTSQDPASIHLHPDCNPYGKQAPWLMTDPSPWDHPCLVIFLPSGSTPFFFAYMYAIFKFNQLALLHFTRYTDIKPAAFPIAPRLFLDDQKV